MKVLTLSLLSIVAAQASTHRSVLDSQTKFAIDAACIGIDPTPDSECHRLCQAGACCFVYEEQCSSDIDCNVYEACDDVFEDNFMGEDGFEKIDINGFDADDITMACENMDPPAAPGHKNLCELLCEYGKCCYDHNECTDSNQNQDDCLKYAGCAILFNKWRDQDDDILNDEDQDFDRRRELMVSRGLLDPNTFSADDVTVACTEMDPTTPGSLCHQMCEAGRCCFENDCDRSTHDDMEHCLKYAACWVFYPDGTVDDDFVEEDVQYLPEDEQEQEEEDEFGSRRQLRSML